MATSAITLTYSSTADLFRAQVEEVTKGKRALSTESVRTPVAAHHGKLLSTTISVLASRGSSGPKYTTFIARHSSRSGFGIANLE